MRTAEEIEGFEYDWLASDADGHVGFFATAGGSYPPEAYLEDTDAHEQAIDAMLAQPTTTVAIAAPTVKPGFENTWRDLAERGFYGFDGDSSGGPYTKVAVPLQPVRVHELPPEVAAVVRRVVFPNLRFAELYRVTEGMLGAFT